jgi:SNF2 family DNA or RNA helicase
MDSDPIDSSPATKRQETPPSSTPAHDTMTATPFDHKKASSDYVSSPASPHFKATQPTQILNEVAPMQLSEILVPATSPVAPNNPLVPGSGDNMAGSSGDGTEHHAIQLSDSEDELSRPDRANIPASSFQTGKAPSKTKTKTKKVIDLTSSDDDLDTVQPLVNPVQAKTGKSKVTLTGERSMAKKLNRVNNNEAADLIKGKHLASPSRHVSSSPPPSAPLPSIEPSTGPARVTKRVAENANLDQSRQTKWRRSSSWYFDDRVRPPWSERQKPNFVPAKDFYEFESRDPKIPVSDSELDPSSFYSKSKDQKEPTPDSEVASSSSAYKGTRPKRSVPDSGLDASSRLAKKKKSNLADDSSEFDSPSGSEFEMEMPKHAKNAKGSTRVVKRRVIDSELEETPRPSKRAKTPDWDAEESEDEILPLHKIDNNLLQFFNGCDTKQLIDIANCTEDIAEIILSKRPFNNLNQIRAIKDKRVSQTKKGKAASLKRDIGERIVDCSEQMWAGLQAIDILVDNCQNLGVTLKGKMSAIGLKVSGSDFSATTLAPSVDSARIDSAMATPPDSTDVSPTQAGKLQGIAEEEHDNVIEEQNIAKAYAAGKEEAIGKPAIMAPDVVLKDYQLVGINWLNQMYKSNISGILADDMGLGKTCQVISFLSHLYTTGVSGISLIVVPGSTLENWIREFKKFSPSLKILAYHGSQAERQIMQKQTIRDKSIHCLVTTYEMAVSKNDNSFLRKLNLATCIYDEGHMLKNKESNRYIQLMKIKSPWRLILTGTPLQNNLQELISILGFIMPSMFEQNMSELNYIFKHRAKTTDKDHRELLSAQRVSRARSMMAPFILRRKKEQVLSLPAKICRVEYCGMTPNQNEMYETVSEAHKIAMQNTINGIENDPRNYLMDRRKAAIHPLLFRTIYTEKDIESMHKLIPLKGKYHTFSRLKLQEEMAYWSDFKLHQACLDYPALEKFALQNNEWMDSGKIIKLLELLKKNVAEGNRTLMFSQFTTVLDIIEPVLEEANISFCRFDGATPIAQRQDYIDAFYEDESIKVFLLSTKSGGTGINLACANKVIIFDGSFNPQDDVQAENRAHRVGQTREVEVVRLVTRGTIEEKIYALGKSKLALDQMVAGEKDDAGVKLVQQMLLDDLAA